MFFSKCQAVPECQETVNLDGNETVNLKKDKPYLAPVAVLKKAHPPRPPAPPSKTEYRYVAHRDRKRELTNRLYKLVAEIHMTVAELETLNQQ